ncbi:MAG: hypothetical protein PHQ97_08390 [Desulfobacterales bacterium]|nr:hypothetical protein [Desulfobacterales bacterium]
MQRQSTIGSRESSVVASTTRHSLQNWQVPIRIIHLFIHLYLRSLDIDTISRVFYSLPKNAALKIVTVMPLSGLTKPIK